MKPYILPLCDSRAEIETVGGKGMSLSKMINAGLPVPDGFHVTTEAYSQFVAANTLQAKILTALKDADASQPASLETASISIGRFFAQAAIPDEIARAIRGAYSNLRPQTMDNRPSFMVNGPSSIVSVAVRSSATAEDLPDASFAGQQETFLNIRGEEALLAAVKKCWASLWTARAIAYRIKNNIDQSTVALAVVVQEMVEAEAAGILFTANPINGRRDEMVINAAWGLGEAIVGGLVSPDTIIADKATGKVKKVDVAEKTVITVLTESGTEEKPLDDARRKSRVLNKAQVRELVNIAREIENFYGKPQDIEWCRRNGKFYIVQSRPITVLPPEWKQPKPKVMYARGSFAEFVPDAVSPLFATLAIPIAKELTLKMMNDILEKDIPDTYQFDVINGYVYVGIPMRWEVLGPFIGATVKMSKTYLKTASERWSVASDGLGAMAAQWRGTDLSTLTAAQLIEGAREIFHTTAEAYNVAQSGTIPNATSSEITFCKFYDLLVKRKGDPQGATLLFGLDNQPLRAEKALFDLAMWLNGQPHLLEMVNRTPTDEIVKRLTSPQDDLAWNEFRSRFTAYLEKFGHAIYDLDFARSLPMDDPAPLVEAVKAYLAGTGGNPYQRQQEAETLRERTIAELTRRLDPLRRKWFLKLLKWAMNTAPQREDSIADMGLGHPQIRRVFGELGRRLVEAGGVKSAQDIYWLQANELESLAAQLDRGGMIEDYSMKVMERKTEHQGFRRLSPPPVLPQNSWLSIFFPHNDQSSDTIKGFAASAGKVTAKACVLFGPEDFSKMRQGDVLVAVTTTPAWTPLFTMASAIVTDIGGPLSHSSIVAREYGIPAVLATGVATRRIREGQTITVDGSAGTVVLE